MDRISSPFLFVPRIRKYESPGPSISKQNMIILMRRMDEFLKNRILRSKVQFLSLPINFIIQEWSWLKVPNKAVKLQHSFVLLSSLAFTITIYCPTIHTHNFSQSSKIFFSYQIIPNLLLDLALDIDTRLLETLQWREKEERERTQIERTIIF